MLLFALALACDRGSASDGNTRPPDPSVPPDDEADAGPPSDRDGDGVPDSEDQCVMTPEVRDGIEDEDGCPEADDDGDGITLKHDKCPLEPEDCDGIEDDDGCPELTAVQASGAEACDLATNPSCGANELHCVPWGKATGVNAPEEQVAPGLCMRREQKACMCREKPPWGCVGEDGYFASVHLPKPDPACKPKRKKGPYCVVATQKILDGMAQTLADRLGKAGFEVVRTGSFEVVFRGARDQLAELFARDPHFSKLRGRCRPRVDQMAVPLEWRSRVASFRPVDCEYDPVVETSGREATEYD